MSDELTLRLGVVGRVVPDLRTGGRVHVVAAGGAAMSAICSILRSLGWLVTGSDQAESAAVDRLRAEGLEVTVGHDPKLVRGSDLVVVSTAVTQQNTELAEAVRLGIPVAGRPEIMESLGRIRRVVAISGTHGKTTTSAMAAVAAQRLGWNPSFIVGGVVNGLATGVQWTDSDLLVVEADESDNSFLRFDAEFALVTNIEADHLDFHGDMAHLEAAFDRFVLQSKYSSVCIDDAGCRKLIERIKATRSSDQNSVNLCTYGFADDADYKIIDAKSAGLRTWFKIVHRGNVLVQMELQVPGLHNALNATGVFSLYHQRGAEPELLAFGLSAFTGVGRRFEFRGLINEITFVDDYAHLPTEVSTVLRSARAGGWSRVVAVFQPHRYTRIRDVGTDFATSFDDADVIIIAGLYSAGQTPIEGVSAHTVFDAIRSARPSANVHLIEDRADLIQFLHAELRAGDVCLTMNAGDLTTLPDDMLAIYQADR